MRLKPRFPLLAALALCVGLEHTDDFRNIMYFFGFGGDIPAYFGRYRALLKRRDDIPNTSGLSLRTSFVCARSMDRTEEGCRRVHDPRHRTE